MIGTLNEEELRDQQSKLHNLLASLEQEYRDREETINLVCAQLDAVLERLADYETETF